MRSTHIGMVKESGSLGAFIIILKLTIVVLLLSSLVIFSADRPADFADQEYVWKALGVDILDQAFKGFNSCLFAYGQSGAGKSYSMVCNPFLLLVSPTCFHVPTCLHIFLVFTSSDSESP